MILYQDIDIIVNIIFGLFVLFLYGGLDLYIYIKDKTLIIEPIILIGIVLAGFIGPSSPLLAFFIIDIFVLFNIPILKNIILNQIKHARDYEKINGNMTDTIDDIDKDIFSNIHWNKKDKL